MESLIRADAQAPALAIKALVDFYRALERRTPQPIAWQIRIPINVYRELWNRQPPMRRKIARMYRGSR